METRLEPDRSAGHYRKNNDFVICGVTRKIQTPTTRATQLSSNQRACLLPLSHLLSLDRSRTRADREVSPGGVATLRSGRISRGFYRRQNAAEQLIRLCARQQQRQQRSVARKGRNRGMINLITSAEADPGGSRIRRRFVMSDRPL